MSYSFKKIKNKSTKNKTDYSLFIMIFFVIVAISCLFIYFAIVNKAEKENVTYVPKINQNKKYVYTVKKILNNTRNETYDNIPTINIAGDNIKKINKQILNTYSKVRKKQEYDYTYKYDISENILSLLVQYGYMPTEDSHPIIFYKTYNIDLETGNIISDNKLLEMYGIDRAQLKIFIEERFKKYYNDLVSKNHINTSECDYSCFTEKIGLVNNYLDGVSLYVDNSKLTLYKYFYKTDYNEYFDNISYQVTLKKKK